MALAVEVDYLRATCDSEIAERLHVSRNDQLEARTAEARAGRGAAPSNTNRRYQAGDLQKLYVTFTPTERGC
jgi:hypothetical protein